jgi:hypothetical protein
MPLTAKTGAKDHPRKKEFAAPAHIKPAPQKTGLIDSTQARLTDINFKHAVFIISKTTRPAKTALNPHSRK